MKRILLISKKRQKFGPISGALVAAAKEMDVDVGFIEETDISDYDSTIIYLNNLSDVPELSSKGKIAWYMCDLRPAHKVHIPEWIDTIFLCNQTYIEQYERAGYEVFYMPQCGLKPGMYMEPEDEAAVDEFDVLFIGHITHAIYHSNRVSILQRLKQEKTKLHFISQHQTTPNQEYLYKNTPISLAISPQKQGYTSNRLYNILASAGFCLTLYFPGIEELFKNHEHLVWFHDEDDMMQEIEHYLDNPLERLRVAESGHRLFKEKHSAEARLKNMFDNMEGESNEFYGYL